MTQRYTCTINLIVLGPFLTAATGSEQYGVDKSAHRDYMGQLVIPASHIKGKLRSSLDELDPFFDPADRPDLKALFGEKSADGSYEPLPATVHFSDLVSSILDIGGTRTRVTINHASQTAQQNMLRKIEDPFPSGTEISFDGKVTFSASDANAAIRLASVLQLGLQWLATVGAEKGVGFGRLKSAKVSSPTENEVPAIQTISGTSNALHLRITAHEPLLAGGIKSRRTNYIVSRQELTGGLLKGALAAALNEAHGVNPVTRPLDASYAGDFPGFEALVKHFSAIRVTHARPTLAGDPRPTRRPLSAVEYEESVVGTEEEGKLSFADVALSNKRRPLVQGRHSPAYYGDAKNLDRYEGLAKPAELFVTRSEINDESQRTAEGQLFTYQFYAPCTENGEQIEWVCNVNFDAIYEPAERKDARQQFAAAVRQHLHRLGKLGRAVTVAVSDNQAAPAMVSSNIIQDGLALVTLQSDAIMLDPDTVRSLPLGQDLYEAYAAYWHDLSNGALALDDFYAHQGFEGGYLYHRYLGAAERSNHPNRYRPYYLTLAGSLFKLRVVNEEIATQLLTRWLTGGLPLPKWALIEYGQYKRPLWETCPFVPENGYGEIAVNLAWHWVRMLTCEVKNDEFAQG